MRIKYNDVEVEHYIVDSVDFLSKGLPPKKTEADACIRAFAQELIDNQDDENSEYVYVNADALEEAIHRVYINNLENTKKWIGISIGTGVAGLLIGALFINR